MKKLEKILKDFKNTLVNNYIDRDILDNKIKKLENERFKLVEKHLDSLYEDYLNDYQINIINNKLDVLYEILEVK